MLRSKNFFCFLIIVVIMLLISIIIMFNNKTTPDISLLIQTPEFWIKNTKNVNSIIMTNQEIKEFNKQNYLNKSTLTCDLKDYPDILSKDQLKSIFSKIEIPKEDRYINNVKIDDSYYKQLTKLMNIEGMPQNIKSRHAYSVKRTNIRSFPTLDIALKSPQDKEFDRFQESVLEVAEPLIVLHQSLDNKWYFIQSSNCFGWVLANNIAIADSKEIWLEYYNSKRFLVICANKLKLEYNPYSSQISELELGMGTKLPIISYPDKPITVDHQLSTGNYVVKIPIRNGNGKLTFKNGLIPFLSDVSIGYLPYTKKNIIKQAFKVLGSRYGWGGTFNSRDCSSFVADVYKTFGIFLPRNTDQQEISFGKTIKFNDIKSRYKVLDHVPMGSLLFMKGHVVIYLGKFQNKYYIIHSFYGYIIKDKDGTTREVTVDANVVTDLDVLLRRNLKPMIECLTSIKQLDNKFIKYIEY